MRKMRAQIIVRLLLDRFLYAFFVWCFLPLSFYLLFRSFVQFFFSTYIPCAIVLYHFFIHSLIHVSLFYCPYTHTQIGLAMVAVSTLVISGIVSYTALCVTAWGYGLAFGCYRYTLKMLALERVRAKHFTKAWGKAAFTHTHTHIHSSYLIHLQNPKHLPYCTIIIIEAFFSSTAQFVHTI